MAAQPLPLSLEEFHALYDGAKPAYEYWHGTAVQKSRPTALHGIVQIILALLLERAGWNAASEVRLKVEKRTAWTLSGEGVAGPSWIAPDGSLRIGDTAIELRQLFAEVDRKLESSEE